MSAATTEDAATRCESCDVVLDDINAAVTCTDHPTCLDCEDPYQTCRDCSLERSRIATDREDDRLAGLARDKD